MHFFEPHQALGLPVSKAPQEFYHPPIGPTYFTAPLALQPRREIRKEPLKILKKNFIENGNNFVKFSEKDKVTSFNNKRQKISEEDDEKHVIAKSPKK